MRLFTKEHNDLEWLYPCKVNYLTGGEEEFNMYEDLANTYFKLAHKSEDSFSKDDLIDAFMKGTSVASQFIGQRLLVQGDNELRMKAFLEESRKFTLLLNEFKDKLDNKDNKTNCKND